MFRSPDEILDARSAVAAQLEANEITPESAIERLRELDPQSPAAFALEGGVLLDKSDRDGAVKAYWNALTAAPCSVGALFHIAGIHEEMGRDASEVLPYRLLGLRRIASCDEVPEAVARNFENLGKAARSPQAYAALAERTEEALGDRPWPERLRPYRLLTDIQRQSQQGLDPDLLRETLERYDTCEPVFRAALRQWADEDAAPISDETASILVAILGEGGAAALIDDIVPDDQYPTSSVLWHAQWAVWRLGQRFPEEAFARLRTIGATADVTARALLAQQFYLLRETLAGRKEAILALLDRFPAEEEPEDSAYLLLTVWRLMQMLGSPVDAKTVVEKYRRRLAPEGRRIVSKALEDTDSAEPEIVSLAFDLLGIEDVVCDLALMDTQEDHPHEHDFEDEEFEDEDDFEEPAPRPGRNDPCWCGSGRKYKKCHLEQDDAERRLADSHESAEVGKVIADIVETVANRMNRADFLAAHRMFFEADPGMFEPDDDASAAFSQWLILDFRAPSTGRTLIEEYLRKRGGRLPERERALVDGFRNARYALWEVTRCNERRGIELKDRFGDTRLSVYNPEGSLRGASGHLVIGYLFERDGRWEFFDRADRVPPAVVSTLEQTVVSASGEAGLSPSEYFRSRSHEWRRVLDRLGREAMEKLAAAGGAFAAAVYDVSDPAAAEDALLRGRMFASKGPGEIDWVDSANPDGEAVFGTIRISGGQLRLECDSRTSLSAGRQLVEKHAGAFLKHQRDDFGDAARQ